MHLLFTWKYTKVACKDTILKCGTSETWSIDVTTNWWATLPHVWEGQYWCTHPNLVLTYTVTILTIWSSWYKLSVQLCMDDTYTLFRSLITTQDYATLRLTYSHLCKYYTSVPRFGKVNLTSSATLSHKWVCWYFHPTIIHLNTKWFFHMNIVILECDTLGYISVTPNRSNVNHATEIYQALPYCCL